jgi:hypothetical protein
MAPHLDGSDEPTATEGAAEPEEPDSPAGAAPPAEPEPAEAAAEDSDAPAEVEAEPVAEAPPQDVAPAPLAPPADVPQLTRLRVLTVLAVGPVLTGYLAVATLLAIVTATAGNARFTTQGVLTAAIPGWLAAHQVPMEIYELQLGVLPLLPTIGLIVLTARTAARAAARLDLRQPGQGMRVVGVVAAAHAVAGLVVAGITVDAQVTADPLAALYYPALVSAFAATAGIARRCGLVAAVVRRADAAALAGLRTGSLAVALLLAAGGLVVVFGLLTSIPAARAMVPEPVGDAVGMLLLSIGYLPNAIVAATSFVAGPGFSLGTVMVAPLEYHGGRLPGVPLLAAMPERMGLWWPALFVLPLVVGVVVGRRLRDVDEDPVTRLRAVAVASGVVALCFVVLAGTAGGRLGQGPFDPVSMRAAAVSVALVLWTAVPGAFVAWFGGVRPALAPMPGLIEAEEEQEEAEEDHDVPEPRDGTEEPAEMVKD